MWGWWEQLETREKETHSLCHWTLVEFWCCLGDWGTRLKVYKRQTNLPHLIVLRKKKKKRPIGRIFTSGTTILFPLRYCSILNYLELKKKKLDLEYLKDRVWSPTVHQGKGESPIILEGSCLKNKWN